jgi:hypothetical protein
MLKLKGENYLKQIWWQREEVITTAAQLLNIQACFAGNPHPAILKGFAFRESYKVI